MNASREPVDLPQRIAPPADPWVRVAAGASGTAVILISLFVATSAHAVAIGASATSSMWMRMYMTELDRDLDKYFRDTVIEVDPPPEPEVEEVVAPVIAQPEPEPEPEPEPQEAEPPPAPDAPEPDAPEPEDDEPYPDDEPAPATAEAADVLTQEGDDDEPVDMSGWNIVSKDGSKSTGGGRTSAEGKSKDPVHDARARNDGVQGGRGTAPAAPRPRATKPNLSRPVGLAGGGRWNCPFPAQADLEQIDRAAAVVVVTVGPNGRPIRARVSSDPGYGFGANARRCALARSFTPARNADGDAITSSASVRVLFDR